MAHTTKHSMRIPDDVWGHAVDQAQEIARLGVRGDHEPFAVADIVRRALAPCATETAVQTMQRLGMHAELIALGIMPLPDDQAAPADV
jgi:hypothetical protein